MFGWLNFENYRKKQRCSKEMREFVGCLAFYQQSISDQNEMCREYHQDLAACMDGFAREIISKNAKADSRKFVPGNQNPKDVSDWSKPSSSGFHLG